MCFIEWILGTIDSSISSLIAEKYLNRNIERKWLEKYILNGNLKEEYMKPYLYENFTINE